ncbi:MAG: hypothetical protein M3N38_02985 [Pseudomonadota bacterium]|nr:hypothetical protein [Pseudomonadota bacterium]
MAPAFSRTLVLLFAGLAWIVACIWLLHSSSHLLTDRLGDADDAMRLVHVRQLLSGQGWFDLHFDRIQPPQGYDSHWSRLIDAGLAGLYRLLVLAADAGRAEILMRATWPLLWLFPALAAVALAAARVAGLPAAVLALVFSAVSIAGLEQFRPGRIDHHNVQIALAVMCVAAIVWSDRSRLAAALAGLFAGAMLAMGLENSPFVMLAAAAMALRYVFSTGAGRETAAFGLALAATAVGVLLGSVPPAAWSIMRCDAVAANIALPVAAGGVLLALAGALPWASVDPSRRLLATGFALLIALALFVGLEPDCINGPFAHVDPAIRPIWLDHVKEARSFFGTIEAGRAGAAVGSITYPLVTLVAGIIMAARLGWRERFPRLVLLAALLMSLCLLMALIRTFTYAVWFAVPVIAIAVVDFWQSFRMNSPAARAASAAIASPLAVTAVAVLLVQAIAPAANDNAESGQENACAASASYRTLAGLPAGLVVSEINLAPLILALTPHSVLSAPYHRLSSGIVDTHGFFSSPAPEALAIARARNIAYVYFCPTFVFNGFERARRDGTLWHDLAEGRIPPWLELVPQSAGEPIRIFKIAGP